MAQSVYIETTIVSYLTAWPSRDVIRLAQQQITREWWKTRAPQFDLVSSELVEIEASAGDPVAAQERMTLLHPLPILGITAPALEIAQALLTYMALPAVANRDAQHVGISAVNGIDYLLTWNCRHLANAQLRDRITSVCQSFGLHAPIICTPTELFGDTTIPGFGDELYDHG